MMNRNVTAGTGEHDLSVSRGDQRQNNSQSHM